MRCLILLTLLLLAAPGCAKPAALGEAPNGDAANDSPLNYRQFARITNRPHDVSFEIASLCRGGPNVDRAFEKKYGPHHLAKVHIYMNPIAKKAFDDGAAVYPAGSIIVKEKLDDDLKRTGVGVMQKRETGHDANSGDWQYMYATDEQLAGQTPNANPFTTEGMQSCVECHAAAKEKDYVFGYWKRTTP